MNGPPVNFIDRRRDEYSTQLVTHTSRIDNAQDNA